MLRIRPVTLILVGLVPLQVEILKRKEPPVSGDTARVSSAPASVV